MSLSKPIINLVASYLQNLYIHPIKTKAITSCVVGSAGSIASQMVSGEKIRLDPVLAFGLYGLIFGGTVPHYFYEFIERIFPQETSAFPLAKKLLFERLIFTPLMQAFSLYTLARFEGKNHKAALKQVNALYFTVLEANWKWLTLFQVINIAFIPPMLRVLFMNLVGFGWAMFIASKRRQQSSKKE
ncbi:peroxisomal membrane protein 2 [Melitaea cinxia]|uniref:peroxisomal membrane protein 2 n=1 Tax=Melitaea cinxia TaxID=113334 RepID=UPI0004EA2750|nr:peroxisomal membrane protein 2 [Melitaea cinxia]